MKKKTGKIISSPDVNIWPHEYETARVLAEAGYDVEFLRRSEAKHATSADVLIDGEEWEIKSPTASNAKAIERNLRKALDQSDKIIFDGRRMKGLPDKIIQRELEKYALHISKIKKLRFVNRRREVIDIK